MLKTNEIQLLANYVLVKPDDHLTTFQMNGKELGLFTSDIKYENGKTINVKERNFSTNGTVYAAPTQLNFYLKKIKYLKSNYETHKIVNGQMRLVNYSVQKDIDELTLASVNFDTDIEVKKGDRVNFSYMAHDKAVKDNLIMETDFGMMYLIKYDMLYMTLDENDKPDKMLNGWILVEPEEVETKIENGLEYIEGNGGLILPTLKGKQKKNRKQQLGKVLKYGTPNRGYLQQPEKVDFDYQFKDNEKLLYDPRGSQKLEYESHQIMSDKKLELVQRKDFWCFVPLNFELDSNKKEEVGDVRFF